MKKIMSIWKNNNFYLSGVFYVNMYEKKNSLSIAKLHYFSKQISAYSFKNNY